MQILELPKTQFDVVLQSLGSSKRDIIRKIKEVRKLTGHKLREALNLVESAPQTILKGVSLQGAESAKAQLERAGGVVPIV